MHTVFIMNNDSDGWIKNTRTLQSTKPITVQSTGLHKKTAQPLVLISNNSRALSQSQEHTNEKRPKSLFKRENFVLHYQYQVSGSVHKLFFLKGTRTVQDLLNSLNQNGITPFKMPVTEPFAHSTPSLRV